MKIVLLSCLLAVAFAAPHKTMDYPKPGDVIVYPKDHGNPDEWGPYYQGDIILPLPPMDKNGLVDTRYRWTDNTLVYEFDDAIGATAWDAAARQIVTGGMDDYVARTGGCMQFAERTTETNYVRMTREQGSGCFSFVGMIGGSQQLNYPDWCLNQYGSVLHEMFHAFGFYHEQSRWDRDSYVIIHYENVQGGTTNNNFDIIDQSVADAPGITYDYLSMMHYSGTAFSTNGEITIETIDPAFQDEIGQRVGFADSDVQRIMNMYNC